MTPTLNITGGSALVAPNSAPQNTSSGYVPFTGNVGSILPTIPNPIVPPPKQVSVVTPDMAAKDAATKKATSDAASAALATQTQNKLSSVAQQQAVQNVGTAFAPQGQQPQQPQTQTQTGPTNAGANTTTDILNILNQGGAKLTDAQARQVAGLDFTGITQNPDGTYTFDASATARAEANQQNLQTGTPGTSEYTATARQAGLDAVNKIETDKQNVVNQILNGTFPLTADQQAQVAGLQAQYDQLKQLQLQANQNYEAGVTLLGIRSGREQYAPGLALSDTNNAVNAGIQKIAALDAEAAAKVGALKQGFMDSDYNIINKAYADLRQATLDKNDILTQMNADMKAQVDLANAKTAGQTTALDLQTKQMNTIAPIVLQSAMKLDGTLDFGVIQKLADQYGVDPNALYGAVQKEQQTETLQQQQDAKFASDQLQAGATLANTEATTKKTYSDINAANNNGNTLAQANLRTTTSGLKYIDGTNLTGKDATAAQLYAANNGLAYLDKTAADLQNNVETARQNMNNIGNSLDGLLATSGLDIGTRVDNVVNAALQTGDKADALASFGAYRSAAIQALRAMAGAKGLRINQAEIMQSVNQDIPKITDTVGVAKSKIAIVNSLLDSQEKGTFGNQNYTPTNGAAGTSNTTVLTGPDGKQYNVPNANVDKFIAAGGHK